MLKLQKIPMLDLVSVLLKPVVVSGRETDGEPIVWPVIYSLLLKDRFFVVGICWKKPTLDISVLLNAAKHPIAKDWPAEVEL